jgi:hypothetical protein
LVRGTAAAHAGQKQGECDAKGARGTRVCMGGSVLDGCPRNSSSSLAVSSLIVAVVCSGASGGVCGAAGGGGGLTCAAATACGSPSICSSGMHAHHPLRQPPSAAPLRALLRALRFTERLPTGGYHVATCSSGGLSVSAALPLGSVNNEIDSATVDPSCAVMGSHARCIPGARIVAVSYSPPGGFISFRRICEFG